MNNVYLARFLRIFALAALLALLSACGRNDIKNSTTEPTGATPIQ